jgi:hypothetical protein
VAEQELDLFDISALLVAKFRASTPKVMRPEALDTDLPWQIATTDETAQPLMLSLWKAMKYGPGPRPVRVASFRERRANPPAEPRSPVNKQ